MIIDKEIPNKKVALRPPFLVEPQSAQKTQRFFYSYFNSLSLVTRYFVPVCLCPFVPVGLTTEHAENTEVFIFLIFHS